MRVGGKNLTIPPRSRPTLGRARQALFDMLAGGRFGECFGDAIVIDGFAGSGALGLEAWSRGAAEIIFIDKSPAACKTIASNIAAMHADSACRVMCCDLTKPMPESIHAGLSTPATLVFLDPPWQETATSPDLAYKATHQLLHAKLIAAAALVIIEHNARLPLAWADKHPHLNLLDKRNWGSVGVVFLRHKN